jgi:hypothetical protein
VASWSRMNIEMTIHVVTSRREDADSSYLRGGREELRGL